jgi:hypothetical protein
VRDDLRGGRSLGAPDISRPNGIGGEAPGTTFVNSEGYRKVSSPNLRGANWSTGAIEIQTKATLLEGDIDSPGTAAALVQPDVRAGVVPTLFQAPRIADLIPTASTTSNRVRVIRESLATNAADTVEEGGEKPESALEFSEDDLDIRKVATFLPLSDELFSDSGAVQSYLNGRLSLFVQIKEDDQLLNGDATGVNLDGLLNQLPGENQDIASDADAPNAADNVFAAISKGRGGPSARRRDRHSPQRLGVAQGHNGPKRNYTAGPPFSNSAEPGEALS